MTTDYNGRLIQVEYEGAWHGNHFAIKKIISFKDVTNISPSVPIEPNDDMINFFTEQIPEFEQMGMDLIWEDAQN